MTLSGFRRATLVSVCAVALIAFPTLAPVLAAADQAGSGLSGRILSEGGAPVTGATVLAYHLASEQVFRSSPTDAKGGYEIAGLPYGYFDVAVETPQGLYVADQVVNVPPADEVVLSLGLHPFAEARAEEGRSFPGTEGDPVGIARVQEKMKGADFWKSSKGVATLAGGGAVLLLLLAGGGGDEDESPSTP